MRETKWEIEALSAEQQAICAQLSDELAISPLAAAILVRRGLVTAASARAFIRPRLEELHDPFLMKDMDKAVDRITRALENHEKILIYGDYDVDGTTAVSLMYKFLHSLYDQLDYYIPDRYTEGYGISFRGIDYAAEHECTLIIALDCGIKSVDKVEYARKRGIDFIICDHHMPDETLPNAVAVLDPHRSDDPYPYTDLCGCGVGFKLAQAYAQRHQISFDTLRPLLELVAMSIASDIVPITGENRILAFFGLREINRWPSVGLKSIMDMAGIHPGKLTISDLVYKIGPRVNACGRIKSGIEAVRLLITEDAELAADMGKAINDYNKSRQDMDKSISEEALQQLQDDPENDGKYSTVVFNPTWHKGVVGIVASRLTETYYRPTIVLTGSEDGIISGSARSVSDFDIYSAIDSCRDLLTNFGGHVYAAGLSMREDNLPEFKRRFEEYVAAHITPEQQEPVISVEAEIQLTDITPQFFRILQSLEPYGPGNPRPVFVTRNLINYRYTKRVGKTGEHLKLDLTDRSASIAGIAFGMGDFATYFQNGNAADVCYELDENHFNGITSIQMQVHDIKKRQ